MTIQPRNQTASMTVGDLISALRDLPSNLLVVVGVDGTLTEPLLEKNSVRLDKQGKPFELCAPATPGATEVLLL